jgi:signal peptidase I
LAECYGTISFVQANWIEICYSPTPSMSPNVSPGDLFINFKNEPFTRWDIVAVDTVTGSNPENGIMHLCKRVVGLPGEQVEITGAGLLIDGKLTAVPNKVGPYAAVDFSNNPLMDAEPMAAANGCWGRPMKLGPDEYFLLGDNSSLSDDGRFWPSMDDHQPGATPRSQIKGRVVGIVWPLARWRMFDPAAPRTEK